MSEKDEYIEIATRHAAIALQWTASDASETGGDGYPIGEGGDEYTDKVAELIAESVAAFVTDNWGTLTRTHIPPEMCGHDFILTANGHGAGFWDRGYGVAGNVLTGACRGYSFDSEFALDEYGNVGYLMVENEIIVDEKGYSA